jgi:small subunit ribosomal protein S18
MAEKSCYFCTNNIKDIDYQDVETLKRFLDAQAKIIAAKYSGVCAKHQRRLAKAIKRARILALLPFVGF